MDGLGDLGPEYVVPNRLVEAVEAIYNYDARRDDELTFKKGDIIVNVKTMPGKLQWFWIHFQEGRHLSQCQDYAG